jgi:hypothetical protein
VFEGPTLEQADRRRDYGELRTVAIGLAQGIKEAISLRGDQDVLEWFRAQGPRYQSRMNAVLRTYVRHCRHAGSAGPVPVRHNPYPLGGTLRVTRSLTMDDALEIIREMNASAWQVLDNSLQEVTDEEAYWRPLPEANTISLIVRHLRIEAEWQVNSLAHGEPMPTIAVAPSQKAIDAVADEFAVNKAKLQELCARFLDILRTTTVQDLRDRTAAAYGHVADRDDRRYFIAYHHATHLAMHGGQIRTIRNLYRKTRGQPARFVPHNPTYPQ